MKHSFSFLLFFGLLAGSMALPQSSSPPKQSAPKSKTASSKKVKSTKKSGVAAATWRGRQMAPTPERYKEIQQALVDRGYLKSQPNGVWDAESSAALMQFQTDQKLTPTGKLSSASLIALGLGPKTADGTATPPAPAAVPQAVVPAAPSPAPSAAVPPN